MEGPFNNYRIKCIDPNNIQWNTITPERIIGCVVYPATEIIEPGVIKHIEGNRFSLGEPGGVQTERILTLGNKKDEDLDELLCELSLDERVNYSDKKSIRKIILDSFIDYKTKRKIKLSNNLEKYDRKYLAKKLSKILNFYD